ncbi:hypothetical protein Tco_0750068 [Tanacetum coccineum]|uniref:Uncharacterized protein n=1 Tax=Tanacetum coccineum TaxID=301880 RepID=A0ABQ4Z2Y9_9ASTR
MGSTAVQIMQMFVIAFVNTFMWIMQSYYGRTHLFAYLIAQHFPFHIQDLQRSCQSLHDFFPDISRPPCSENVSLILQDLCSMKNIFNSRRHKNKVGMQIPAWMITDEMKQTEHYRMYAEVFGIDVPLTQSQPTESTHGMHRTTSAPRRSTRLTPPAPVPTIDKADEMILQDTLQVSLAEHKSREEQEARENVALKLQELTDTPHTTSSSSPHKKLAKTNRLLSLFKTKPTRSSKQYKSSFTSYKDVMLLVCTLRARTNPMLMLNPDGVNSAKRQRRTSEYELMCLESHRLPLDKVFQEEQAPINFRISRADDDFDF